MGGGVGNGTEGKFCMPLCVYINLIHTFMCENHKSGVCCFVFFFKFISNRLLNSFEGRCDQVLLLVSSC